MGPKVWGYNVLVILPEAMFPHTQYTHHVPPIQLLVQRATGIRHQYLRKHGTSMSVSIVRPLTGYHEIK